MFHPSAFIYLLALFYAVFGVVVFRRMRRPTCRICLHRSRCPHRRRRFLGLVGTLCYEREKQQAPAPHLTVLQESSPAEPGSDSR